MYGEYCVIKIFNGTDRAITKTIFVSIWRNIFKWELQIWKAMESHF